MRHDELVLTGAGILVFVGPPSQIIVLKEFSSIDVNGHPGVLLMQLQVRDRNMVPAVSGILPVVVDVFNIDVVVDPQEGV